jgi:hypothetical protein
MIVEARAPNPGTAGSPLGRLWADPPASSDHLWLLQPSALLGLWLHHFHPCPPLMASSSVPSLCVPSSHQDTSHGGALEDSKGTRVVSGANRGLGSGVCVVTRAATLRETGTHTSHITATSGISELKGSCFCIMSAWKEDIRALIPAKSPSPGAQRTGSSTHTGRTQK